ncbi:IPT/TIG domain-containing protein [Lacinutrix cladophorae]
MKRTIYILAVFIFLFNCSKDDDTKDQLVPTAESFSPSSAYVDDIITITGTYLNLDGAYNIKFNDLTSTIVEQTETTVKVRVPENATSGNITFNYENNTQIALGNFLLLERPQIESISSFYARIGDTIIFTGNNFNIDDTYQITFNGNPASNIEITDTTITVEVPDNAETGILNVAINEIEYYSQQFSRIESKLFAIKGEVPNQSLVELNLLDGTEVGTIVDFSNFGFDIILGDSVFNSSTNEIFIMSDPGMLNDYLPRLIKVNVDTNNYSVIQANNDFGNNDFGDRIAVSNDGRLFIWNSQLSATPEDGYLIREIDPNTLNFLNGVDPYGPNAGFDQYKTITTVYISNTDNTIYYERTEEIYLGTTTMTIETYVRAGNLYVKNLADFSEISSSCFPSSITDIAGNTFDYCSSNLDLYEALIGTVNNGYIYYLKTSSGDSDKILKVDSNLNSEPEIYVDGNLKCIVYGEEINELLTIKNEAGSNYLLKKNITTNIESQVLISGDYSELIIKN